MLQWLHNHSQCFSSSAPCLVFHKWVQDSQSTAPVTRTAVLGDAKIPASSQARSPQCSRSAHLCSIITSGLICCMKCHPCCRKPGGVNRRRGRITRYPIQPHMLGWGPQRLNLLPTKWKGSGLNSEPGAAPVWLGFRAQLQPRWVEGSRDYGLWQTSSPQ